MNRNRTKGVNRYAYELDYYGDRWTGTGHGIVNIEITPEQQKIVDEWNAAQELLKKEKKNTPFVLSDD